MFGWRAILVGLGLATLTILTAKFTGAARNYSVWAVGLVLIALVYLVFALRDGRRQAILIESCAVVFFVLVAIGGWRVSLLILAFGYAAHGVWDALHHPHAVTTKVVRWYPPFCAVYDWAVAAYLLFIYWPSTT